MTRRDRTPRTSRDDRVVVLQDIEVAESCRLAHQARVGAVRERRIVRELIKSRLFAAGAALERRVIAPRALSGPEPHARDFGRPRHVDGRVTDHGRRGFLGVGRETVLETETLRRTFHRQDRVRRSAAVDVSASINSMARRHGSFCRRCAILTRLNGFRVQPQRRTGRWTRPGRIHSVSTPFSR